MALVEKSVLIEHTPDQMFHLVDGVEHYPHFLPWCAAAECHERTDILTRATLHIDYHGIRTNFSTENTKEAPTLMLIRLTQGPFTRMDGTWQFKPLGPTACKIEFRLHYEFSNQVLESALGPVFRHIAESFIDSFVRRAGSMYG